MRRALSWRRGPFRSRNPNATWIWCALAAWRGDGGVLHIDGEQPAIGNSSHAAERGVERERG